MTPNEHIREVQRTNTGLRININESNEDLLHAIMGIYTEAGELTDALKKHLFYGAPLDMANIKEELGDMFWYQSILLEWCGFTYEEVMEANIEKLRVRYPEKFTTQHALKRNLAKERKVLEK